MSEPRRALITGITGQDGSYLAEFLIGRGYQVHGLIRRHSSIRGTARLDAIYQDPHEADRKLILHYGDMTDSSVLNRLISEVRPAEIYNLAAQSHVKVSFEEPEHTGDVVGLGTVRVLDAIRHLDPQIRYYQASSSEMFGRTPPPQSEASAFHPRSPYAAAKLYAHALTVNYREAYGLFAVSGILFNHESPRRGETFVTRKITRAVAAIVAGRQELVHLGNLEARRDWGYAPDYVEAMWLMLQRDEPEDFVIATGESHSVREFAERAFGEVGRDWREHVRVDPAYFRPSEVDSLLGDPTRARDRLGWTPRVRFAELVRIMVEADLEAEGIAPQIHPA